MLTNILLIVGIIAIVYCWIIDKIMVKRNYDIYIANQDSAMAEATRYREINNRLQEQIASLRKLSNHPQFVVIESMQSRVPVITTCMDSNVELIRNGHNGYLVPAGDVDATAGDVEDILNNRQKVSAIGNKAFNDINSNWNWDIYLKELIKVYKQAMR